MSRYVVTVPTPRTVRTPVHSGGAATDSPLTHQHFDNHTRRRTRSWLIYPRPRPQTLTRARGPAADRARGHHPAHPAGCMCLGSFLSSWSCFLSSSTSPAEALARLATCPPDAHVTPP